ncbi:MAG: dihydroorotase [Ruminococcaceae bacterium]|nr:dihydroorotase [Oscillospiraceae bacterium]
MNCILKNATVYVNKEFTKKDVFIVDGTVTFEHSPLFFDFQVIPCDGKYIFPGFADVHVHLREPGFSYKENIETGTKAAAHGGYTTVCSMPNLKPAPDSMENLTVQLDAIGKSAVINVIPFGTITKGSQGDVLSDMEDMAKDVAGFSDDGRGVQNREMMLAAMKKAKALGKIISAHCEDNSLLRGGYIHDGEYAKEHGHKGICSESEWGQIKRDLELVKESGCAYHVCHISTKESVALIRQAKKDGLDVTCETGPHYLVFSDKDLQEDGRFKMNPPIRSEEDRLALIEGIKDGTIDMIATDHAPHSFEEKSKGLKNSLMGVVGIETSFPVLYTNLVKTNIITLEKLIELLHINPCKRFGIDCELAEGKSANLTVFDLESAYKIDSNSFLSMGKSTPFEGDEVFGECLLTVANGHIAWQRP